MTPKEQPSPTDDDCYLLQSRQHGPAALLISMGESLVGAVAYSDDLRAEAPRRVAALRKRSIDDTVMLTGRRYGVARQAQ